MSLTEMYRKAFVIAQGKADVTAALTLFGQSSAPSYNPSSGAVTRNEDGGTAVTAIVSSYTNDEIDGVNILPNDRKCQIQASDISVVPTTSMRLTDATGNWEIVNVRRVPATAVDADVVVWILQARRP